MFYPLGRDTRNNKIKTIKINNTNVKPTNTTKYLGVTLDYRLTFRPHIVD